MLHKESFRGIAKANPAKTANVSNENGSSLAGLATLALATSQNEATDSKTLAELAALALATCQNEKADTNGTPDQPTAEIWVIAFNPNGVALNVKADNPEHAEQLQRMNPPQADNRSTVGAHGFDDDDLARGTENMNKTRSKPRYPRELMHKLRLITAARRLAKSDSDPATPLLTKAISKLDSFLKSNTTEARP